MRRRYRYIDGEFVEVYNSEEARAKALNSFTSDEMEPTKHPVTGEYFTSKSKFRSRTRELGYEEVGNSYEKGWTPEKDNRQERRLREERVNILRELVG